MTNPVTTAREVSDVTIRVSSFNKRFPIWNAVRTELSWTHYRTLLRVGNEQARHWYMNEAASQNWKVNAERWRTALMLWWFGRHGSTVPMARIL